MTSPTVDKYLRVKLDHPEAIVFITVGAFCQTFFEDAAYCHQRYGWRSATWRRPRSQRRFPCAASRATSWRSMLHCSGKPVAPCTWSRGRGLNRRADSRRQLQQRHECRCVRCERQQQPVQLEHQHRVSLRARANPAGSPGRLVVPPSRRRYPCRRDGRLTFLARRRTPAASGQIEKRPGPTSRLRRTPGRGQLSKVNLEGPAPSHSLTNHHSISDATCSKDASVPLCLW